MKRANGTGSVVKLSGKRRRPWAVRVSGHDDQGRIIQRTISYHEKASEAQAALTAYNQMAAAGKAPDVSAMDMTVQQVFDGWKARTYRRLNPGSIACHNAAWNNRISRFADRKMRQVTLDEWQSILDEDEDRQMSQSTITNDTILIKALNRYAMERDIIAKDYSAYLDIPRVDAKSSRNALTDLQVKQIENMAAAGVPYADTVLILCYTGFRINEFLSLTRFSYHLEDGGYLQGGLKTNAGRNRIIPIHPKIAPYLQAWMKKEGDTIICTESGKAFRAADYRKHFAEIMEQIGAKGATPHWCRHTFATRLHAAGVDPLTVKWLMGHSTQSDVTAHYTHETIETLKTGILRIA